MSYLLKDKLRNLRKSRNLTQTDLGNYLNMTRQGYAHYEKGHRSPDFQTILKLAELYQVSVDELIDDEELPLEISHLYETTPYNVKNKSKKFNTIINVSSNEKQLIKIFRKLNDKEQKILLNKLIKITKKK